MEGASTGDEQRSSPTVNGYEKTEEWAKDKNAKSNSRLTQRECDGVLIGETVRNGHNPRCVVQTEAER